MKRNQGFTLLELLAVMVVLGVIVLIAVPMIMDVIENSKMGTIKNSASGIVDAARQYHALEMEDKGVTTNVTITFPETEKTLEYDGEDPDWGTVVIEPSGKVSLALMYGKYCASKAKSTDKITVIKSPASCTLPS